MSGDGMVYPVSRFGIAHRRDEPNRAGNGRPGSSELRDPMVAIGHGIAHSGIVCCCSFLTLPDPRSIHGGRMWSLRRQTDARVKTAN
jgi:hypothetical protein